MNLAFDFEAAKAARDAGMAAAIDHAETVEPDFGAQALAWILSYARTHARFISEEVTDAAAAAGLQSPTDPRAWGAPFQRAARLGVIRKDGFGISKRRHLSPTPLWVSQVYVGQAA